MNFTFMMFLVFTNLFARAKKINVCDKSQEIIMILFDFQERGQL